MSSAIIIKAPAKINLGLTVLKRRPDGYHDLRSVMQQVSLADTICLEPGPGPGFLFFCTDPALRGKENLVCRAAALLSAGAPAELPGVKLSLYKQIPAAAGLGGGSSDAAAALKGLNRFWKLGLSEKELMDIGAHLGSDIPYCLRGGTMLAAGRGEKLTALPALPFCWVVLAVPEGVAFSTKEIYGALDPARFCRPSLAPLIRAIREHDAVGLREWFSGGRTNTLEGAVLPLSPSLKDLKKKFLRLGLSPALSGSGPAYFALTGDLRTARAAVSALRETGERAYLCWTVPA